MGMNESMKALSDPVRRHILEKLKAGTRTAGEIAADFDLSNATVSYHLKLLKQAGFISEHKEKNFIYYELNTTVFEDILRWLHRLGG
ncbi:winged helix-turn-helix transcriptional regulator [Lactobacillus sp. CC-MHH1034]|uniref:autorepressor SdpR family transcription factor n=1 Tax=Agrilactobacillus fermenti TaxID=2586909 RepID=UPI001E5D33E4|nr:autorepressor SdpR family transcription factor [Agrilactobacillus fermenti]MCD2256374.1 winged helix-turn-helix transcriptional regulator [Agrilactobacillus fermenti]